MVLRWIRTATGINVIVKGESKLVPVDHKHYKQILAGLQANDASVLELVDELKRRINDFSGVDFEILGGELLFRGQPYHNDVLTEKILAMIDRGFEAAPLVRFLEKLEQNPQPESVKMLWDWLQNVGLAIADDGDILGFKYVTIVSAMSNDATKARLEAMGAVYTDSHSYTFNMTPGQICEMPRHKVAFDPSNGCAAGLHVGTHNYTKSYRTNDSQTVVMVKVNPADVVSVPTGECEKMRCCRYVVLEQFDDVDEEGLKEPVYKVDGTKLTISDFYKSRTIPLPAGECDNDCADHWDCTNADDEDDFDDEDNWNDEDDSELEDEDNEENFDEDGGQFRQYGRDNW